MLSCKDVSELVSESLDHRIPWWKWPNLWMHLSMCRLCSRFRKDMLHLHHESHRLSQQSDLDHLEANFTLSAESRERIIEKLKSQQ